MEKTMETTREKPTQKPVQKQKHRSIWISDVHLGTPACQAEALCQFLKLNEAETIYLVGDIIDGWRLKGSFYWPQEHTNVLRRLMTAAKRGSEVIYITGNHDEFLRRFVHFQLELGNIKLVNEAVHETADGRRLLVLHGDLFDMVTRYHKWLADLGDAGYHLLMRANKHFNRLRRRVGLPYWSMSAYAKHKVKEAVNFVSDFEDSVAYECRQRGFDGVVCGHIHYAEARKIDGIDYYNTGDWVESCTAVTEDFDGNMQVVNWAEQAGLPDANIVPFEKAA